MMHTMEMKSSAIVCETIVQMDLDSIPPVYKRLSNYLVRCLEYWLTYLLLSLVLGMCH